MEDLTYSDLMNIRLALKYTIKNFDNKSVEDDCKIALEKIENILSKK